VTNKIKPATTRPTRPAAVAEVTWDLLGIMPSLLPRNHSADSRSRIDNLAAMQTHSAPRSKRTAAGPTAAQP
jgi:hypothetical protein